MKYVGMYAQVRDNNLKSIILLFMFPCILLGMTWVCIAILASMDQYNYDWVADANEQFLAVAPWVIGGVAVWFAIAYAFNASMIESATNARPLERKENPRVYNIVENLTMTCGMDMPKINIINSPELNAFASGISRDSYTVTVTTGILNVLDDEELAGVIGHELTHIRNRDTRLLITSIIFVGIVSTLMSLLTRLVYDVMWYGGSSRKRDKEGGGASVLVALVVALICSAIAYVFILLTRFAISRKREYMADAGGAELCGNPLALASALRKISGNPGLGEVSRSDIAQLYIALPKMKLSGASRFFGNMFSTHPDINRRIEILEQF